MIKKVIVTGGAGFIGSHICDYFLSRDCKVVALDDLSSGSENNLDRAVQLERVDIRTSAAANFIQNFAADVIIHAAAQMSVSESMKNPSWDADVNILGLINILTAVKASQKPTYFLFISTGGAIYGEQEVFPAPENHAIRPTSFYGLSKYVSELYLDLWQRSYGIKYGVVRLANVYGPRQNPHGEAGVIAIFNKLLIAGKQPTIYGTGKQTRDYIYVTDVVKAIAKMCEQSNLGTYNVGTGVETDVNHLYQQILLALDIQQEVNYAPPRSGDQLRSVISSAKAAKELEWQPECNLEHGLKLTSDWFRKNSN